MYELSWRRRFSARESGTNVAKLGRIVSRRGTLRHPPTGAASPKSRKTRLKSRFFGSEHLCLSALRAGWRAHRFQFGNRIDARRRAKKTRRNLSFRLDMGINRPELRLLFDRDRPKTAMERESPGRNCRYSASIASSEYTQTGI
ncbi:hypothetical protein [Brevirhabdus sp.]|uniref:hypothetical protein n=1 Tax=Brevirhabdus sp. TaxID=2004514 RepID=UPI004058885A